ncbi:MAG: hypothetical protein J5828_00155, partial [Desulfovibrionaceae bacterium]|nr:hypothetical protein [Desulfovibrionaceae bacterium]
NILAFASLFSEAKLKVFVPVRSSLVKEPCCRSGNPCFLAKPLLTVKHFFSDFFRAPLGASKTLLFKPP